MCSSYGRKSCTTHITTLQYWKSGLWLLQALPLLYFVIYNQKMVMATYQSKPFTSHLLWYTVTHTPSSTHWSEFWFCSGNSSWLSLHLKDDRLVISRLLCHSLPPSLWCLGPSQLFPWQLHCTLTTMHPKGHKVCHYAKLQIDYHQLQKAKTAC